MRYLAALFVLLVIASPASARHRHHQQRAVTVTAHQDCNLLFPCEGVIASPRGERAVKAMGGFGQARPQYTPRRAEVIGGRPNGCPHAFCGCGASLYLFGKIIPSLNLAANWYRFPRTNPAPLMAAVRRHHVFVLLEHVQGNVWTVHDSNSGHHLTRVHERSIAGYTVVNPRA